MHTYKLIDRQGGGLKKDNIYRSEDEVLDDLRSFHSADVENTDKMTLNDLLEIGEWELVKVDGGQASILIKLEDGNIIVEHGTEHNGTPLLRIDNAKEGSWDRIWATLKAIESENN